MNETERRKSQSTNILLALQSGRRLTCLNMLQDFHCGNGKGRIHELRKTHPEIQDEWITTEGGARVKRWFVNILMCKGNGHHNWSLKKESCECGELKSNDEVLEFASIKVPEGKTLEIGAQLRLIA